MPNLKGPALQPPPLGWTFFMIMQVRWLLIGGL